MAGWQHWRAWQCRWVWRRRLSPYLDGELPTATHTRVEAHLAQCAACRARLEDLRFTTQLVTQVPIPLPTAIPAWRVPTEEAAPVRQAARASWIPVAAAIVLLFGGWFAWRALRTSSATWTVSRLSGTPTIGATYLAQTGTWREGEWLETPADARALIQVGAWGQVEVEPRSRVQLRQASDAAPRLVLTRGRLLASIVAPPRVFQVETPSAVAIDLGCAYALEVDESGGSVLHVTSGWVALARNGREAFVPAGARCRAEADGRLGTPHFEDASEKLQQALARFDFATDKTVALAEVMTEARARDALTLWHLLSRVEGQERERLYERLLALIPSAQSISKTDTLRLAPAALTQWKEAVEFASLGVDPRTVPVAAGLLQPVGPMLATRSSHTATLLPNGQVLLAGGGDRDSVFASAELFDPATGHFTATGTMTTPRFGHEATLLPNGQVLITGGLMRGEEMIASAELYDPATQRFTPIGKMQLPRVAHRALLLPNGKVLITGGLSSAWPRQRLAELYDPATKQFSPIGEMTIVRADHTATLLPNGQVLLSGGSTGRRINQDVTDTAELFDPATNRFTATEKLAVPRHKHAAVALRDGSVLVLGGADSGGYHFHNSAELYDPATQRFSATNKMNTARFKIREAAVVLTNGQVLIAGGGMRLELYDPTDGLFRLLPDRLTTALRYSTTTLLPNGKALIAGGYGNEGLPSAGAWLYSSAPHR